MEAHEQVTALSCTFLALPREVRSMILRPLLLCTESIPYYGYGRSPHLHPQILRVNRQLYSEGLDVLYGENYFCIGIKSSCDYLYAHFLEIGHFAEDVGWYLPEYKRIRHYDISAWIHDDDTYWGVESTIRSVANVLSDIPTLNHLRITLREYSKDKNPPGEALHAFVLLRGVGRVYISGDVQPDFARYLEGVMQGSWPRDHLPAMYEALEHFVKPFDDFEDDLQMARNAVNNGNVEQFKHIRSKLARTVLGSTKRAFDQLLDYDADREKWREWKIYRITEERVAKDLRGYFSRAMDAKLRHKI